MWIVENAEDPAVHGTPALGGRDILQVRNSVQEADAAVDQHALEAEAEPVQARQPLRGQQALRLQLVVLELLAELQEGPALQVHELVLNIRRTLAGVQGLVASEGRVELDEMALELGRRHE